MSGLKPDSLECLLSTGNSRFVKRSVVTGITNVCRTAGTLSANQLRIKVILIPNQSLQKSRMIPA